MLRYFASLLILFSVVLWAGSGASEEKKIRLQAEKINGDEGNLYARGHILLQYDDTLFMADFADYDKQHKRLVIYGKVKIVNPNGSRVETNKITLNITQGYVVFEKFFYSDREDLWFSSDQAEKKKDCYHLKQAIFSSCAVSNPDWHLGFSEAEYNTTTKYIKLKDIKFYVGKIPVFYFPYLSFSASKERSSGLLIPRFGYGAKEGFLYEQPLYWAISPQMDMEFNPQLRTQRGAGIYTTLRFADSSHSEGLVRTGYFSDKSAYTSEYDLKNSTHYGIEGKYDSSDLLGKYKPEGYSDGLYANISFFNDIDYLNLQKNSIDHLTDSYLKESRINYMFYDPNHYFGVNAKYFLDANHDSNKETLQELPSLRWHKYATNLGSDAFTYSVDTKLSHFTREKGTRSKQFEIAVPLAYQLSFLDEYLKVELSENIYAFAGRFDTDNIGKDSYHTLLVKHQAKFYADLIRPYSSGTHALGWSVVYTKQDHLGEGQAEYQQLDPSLRQDFLSDLLFDDKLTFSLNQYWYSPDLSLHAKQRVSQGYYPDSSEKWGDLRHELALGYGKWSIVNLFEYSFAYQNFSELSNKLLYQGDRLYLDVEHFWRKDLALGKVLTNEIALDAKYSYSKQVKFFGNVTYDLDQKYSKRWRSGILYDKGCWSVELSYQHDTKPVLENAGGGSINNDTFLVRLNLIPFGESEIRQ